MLKRSLFAVLALIAFYLITPPFVVRLQAALPYTELCTSGGSGDDGLDSPWVDLNGTVFTHVSNFCATTGGEGAAWNVFYLGGETMTANQTIAATFVTAGNAYSAIFARLVNTGSWATTDGYVFYNNINAGELHLVTDGVHVSQIGSDFSDPDGLSVELELVGSTCEVFYTGVSQGTRDCSTYTAAGVMGIGAYGVGGRLDNVIIDNIGGGGPTGACGLLLGVFRSC